MDAGVARFNICNVEPVATCDGHQRVQPLVETLGIEIVGGEVEQAGRPADEMPRALDGDRSVSFDAVEYVVGGKEGFLVFEIEIEIWTDGDWP